jgi:ribosomal protein S18 acetylase RimI-like enzyme
MLSYEFKSIDINDIDQMVVLLLDRQALESQKFSFLNNSSLNKEDIKDKLEKYFQEGLILGKGAYLKGQLVGFLFAEIIGRGRMGTVAHVPYEGMAIDQGQPYELVRILYSKLAPLWLEQGCFNQMVLLPKGQAGFMDAFINLNFSLEQVYSVLNMEHYKPFEGLEDYRVRLVRQGDEDALEAMAFLISKSYNQSPVFLPVYPEILTRIKKAFRSLVDDEECLAFICEKDGKALGFIEYEYMSSSLMNPDQAIELSTAGSLPDQRTKGVGKKLANHSLNYIKEKGYKYVFTDWKVSNLEASIFWPKCGFEIIACKMIRTIDLNYAWANFKNPSIDNI